MPGWGHCEEIFEANCYGAHIHTYISTYMHAYMHAFMHTYIHTYIHAFMYIRMYIIHISVTIFGCRPSLPNPSKYTKIQNDDYY